jgi:HEAT repeat protein
VISYAPHRPGGEGAPSVLARRAIRKIVLGSGVLVERRDPEPDSTAAVEPLDPDVERAISVREIVALSNAADRTAIEKLRETVLASEDPATRRAALSALAGIAGRQNLDLFIRSGLADADQSVRVEAARGIVRLMGDRGRTIVDAAASREDDPAIRDIMQRLARGEIVERTANRISAGFRR